MRSGHTLLRFHFCLTVHIPLFLPSIPLGQTSSPTSAGQSSGESKHQHVGLKAQSQEAVGDQGDPSASQDNQQWAHISVVGSYGKVELRMLHYKTFYK